MENKRGLSELFQDKKVLAAFVAVILIFLFILYKLFKSDEPAEKSGAAQVGSIAPPVASFDSTKNKSKLELASEAVSVQNPGEPETYQGGASNLNTRIPSSLSDYVYTRGEKQEEIEAPEALNPAKPSKPLPEPDEDEEKPAKPSKEDLEKIEKQKRLLALLEEYKRDKAQRKVSAEDTKKISRVATDDVVSTLAAPARGGSNAFYGLHSDNQRKRLDLSDDSLKTIRAVIHKNQTIVTGGRIQIRLLEPMKLRGREIPAGTMIFGLCNFGTERVSVNITSIQLDGKIIPAAIKTYDMDGMQGIYVPNILAVDQMRRTSADVAQSINIPIGVGASNTEAIIAAQAAQAAIQGGKNLINRKANTQKATLKDNYVVLLR